MTARGFHRWLKSLRTLNTQRHAIEQHAAELRALAEQLGSQRHTLDQREREAAELAARLDGLQRRVDHEGDQERQVREGVRLEIIGVTSRLDALARSGAERDSAASGLMAEADALRTRLTEIAPAFPSISGLASDDSAAWLHSAVEGTFRGPVEEIRARLRAYVPFLARLPVDARELPALDLGCGRGEWLELLRDERMTAVGVDDNPVSVERCVARGLQVVRGDAIAYLLEQPDHAFSVVSLFHVVEHLPTETMVRMLLEARRVLIPGGLLIVETPNPDNLLVASSSFHLDPTHRRPIPLPLLRVIVEFAKFHVVETLALQPDDAMREAALAEAWPATLTRLLAGPRDSGIVATKPHDLPSSP